MRKLLFYYFFNVVKKKILKSKYVFKKKRLKAKIIFKKKVLKTKKPFKKNKNKKRKHKKKLTKIKRFLLKKSTKMNFKQFQKFKMRFYPFFFLKHNFFFSQNPFLSHFWSFRTVSFWFKENLMYYKKLSLKKGLKLLFFFNKISKVKQLFYFPLKQQSLVLNKIKTLLKITPQKKLQQINNKKLFPFFFFIKYFFNFLKKNRNKFFMMWLLKFLIIALKTKLNKKIKIYGFKNIKNYRFYIFLKKKIKKYKIKNYIKSINKKLKVFKSLKFFKNFSFFIEKKKKNTFTTKEVFFFKKYVFKIIFYFIKKYKNKLKLKSLKNLKIFKKLKKRKKVKIIFKTIKKTKKLKLTFITSLIRKFWDLRQKVLIKKNLNFTKIKKINLKKIKRNYFLLNKEKPLINKLNINKSNFFFLKKKEQTLLFKNFCKFKFLINFYCSINTWYFSKKRLKSVFKILKTLKYYPINTYLSLKNLYNIAYDQMYQKYKLFLRYTRTKLKNYIFLTNKTTKALINVFNLNINKNNLNKYDWIFIFLLKKFVSNNFFIMDKKKVTKNKFFNYFFLKKNILKTIFKNLAIIKFKKLLKNFNLTYKSNFGEYKKKKKQKKKWMERGKKELKKRVRKKIIVKYRKRKRKKKIYYKWILLFYKYFFKIKHFFYKIDTWEKMYDLSWNMIYNKSIYAFLTFVDNKFSFDVIRKKKSKRFILKKKALNLLKQLIYFNKSYLNKKRNNKVYKMLVQIYTNNFRRQKLKPFFLKRPYLNNPTVISDEKKYNNRFITFKIYKGLQWSVLLSDKFSLKFPLKPKNRKKGTTLYLYKLYKNTLLLNQSNWFRKKKKMFKLKKKIKILLTTFFSRFSKRLIKLLLKKKQKKLAYSQYTNKFYENISILIFQNGFLPSVPLATLAVKSNWFLINFISANVVSFLKEPGDLISINPTFTTFSKIIWFKFFFIKKNTQHLNNKELYYKSNKPFLFFVIKKKKKNSKHIFNFMKNAVLKTLFLKT